MFKNTFQSGFLSILYSIGSKPLQIWDQKVRNGHIKRVTDDDIKSFVMEIVGANVSTTYVTCPAEPQKTLGIKLPFLAMIIKNLDKYFAFEVLVLDDTKMRRRFRASNYQTMTKVTQFMCIMPMRLDDGWNQIQFNLSDFTRKAYGTNYVETLRVQIHANCRIRRVYFSDRFYSEDELPPDYKLYLPMQNKGGVGKDIQYPHSDDVPSSGKNKGEKAGREGIQVIAKDLIRNPTVPMEDPSGQSIMLHQGESGARVLTKEEREIIVEEVRKKEIDACAQRKTFMKFKDEKLNDLEKEAREQAQYLLDKAKEQQEEQEDEIKHLNELILNAKDHAIRDAQILEKGEIQKELTEQEEGKRLNMMTEAERVNALKLQEDIAQRRKYETLIGKQQILGQIQNREEERLLDQEKKDQATLQMMQYLQLEKLQMEDLKEREQKRQQQLDTQAEIPRANQEADEMRAKQPEQERLSDQKVMEYMKQRAQKEAEFEAEQERIRIEKEKEIARLGALQERAKDFQAEKDALRAKRNQEQREREWREKEN
ncbi:CFAP20 [Branchiostoma lanceolatum]|uniref:CFAP20 protein n=1 Tax=Branchiostoma lanceolatum TaxID=7740 RepID=A0A8K0ACK8_BRALA|nr:CFAP20 [Branchiostoma lanceolatum]